MKNYLASQQVSNKTVLNYHIGLSALWTWAVEEELVATHIIRKVERAKPEKRSIVPYSIDEIKAMLGALASSRPYTRPRMKQTSHALPTPQRYSSALNGHHSRDVDAAALRKGGLEQRHLRNSHAS